MDALPLLREDFFLIGDDDTLVGQDFVELALIAFNGGLVGKQPLLVNEDFRLVCENGAKFVHEPYGLTATLLLHEKRQRSGVAMEEILLADRSNLAITEEASQPQRPEALLNHLSIVIGPAKQVLAAPVATAETTAVNPRITDILLGTTEQLIHVLCRCSR
jgi:hypothetical protein